MRLSIGAVPGLLPSIRRPFLAGVWRLVDPKIALASVVPFVVGVAIAFEQRATIRWGLAAAAFAAIFLVEVGKNAVNDLCDFETDIAVAPEERSPFSGGKRVLVDALLTDHDLVIIAWVAFLAAGAVGLEVAGRTRPELLLLGLAAALISVVYAAPPLKLAARGLGELAVFAVYGPGIVLGTVLLLDGTISLEAVLASITLGLLIANVLLINEIPDERADRLAGKKTLVVRLGRDRAEALLAIAFTVAWVIPVVAAAYGLVPFRITATLAGSPAAALAMSSLRRAPHGHPPVLAQALTLVTYVITGVAFAVALLVGEGG
jgi:1,4-dihydroxy-2-naphthoate octaprenyltransferase